MKIFFVYVYKVPVLSILCVINGFIFLDKNLHSQIF